MNPKPYHNRPFGAKSFAADVVETVKLAWIPGR